MTDKYHFNRGFLSNFVDFASNRSRGEGSTCRNDDSRILNTDARYTYFLFEAHLWMGIPFTRGFEVLPVPTHQRRGVWMDSYRGSLPCCRRVCGDYGHCSRASSLRRLCVTFTFSLQILCLLSHSLKNLKKRDSEAQFFLTTDRV